MTVCDLTNRDCAPCNREGTTLRHPAEMMAGLHADWRLEDARLLRRYTFKGFAKAVQMANLAAWLGERLGHHPDVGFGWGWCEVAFTSHELGGLTENDFIAAAKLDAITN
jgi:4a-hydroxytetrahydrobiopterin dehydratase